MHKPSKKKPAKGAATPSAGDGQTIDALLDLAEALMSWHFASEENIADYDRMFRRRTRRGKPSAEPKPLGNRAMPGGGMLGLLALPEPMGFIVLLQRADLRAVVEASFNVELDTLLSGRVAATQGNAKALRGLARTWAEELDAEAIDGPPSDPAEPPAEATPADVDQVRRIAAAVVRGVAGKTHRLPMSDQDIAWLAEAPQTLWPMLDGLLDACRAAPRNDSRIDAYRVLLTLQLENIRYRMERGWDWAIQMLDDYQQRILEIGRGGSLEHHDWQLLVTALGQAKIPVKPAVSEALVSAGNDRTVEQATPEAMRESLLALLDEMASAIDGPFEVLETLSDFAAVMPAGLRTFIVHELGLSPHQVLRDAVPLMLLDADAGVRRAAASLLERTAEPATLSPQALRRVIAVRNWLPDADRAAADRAIRKARAGGVQCAPWPAAPELAIHASTIDGAGAQSLILVPAKGRSRLSCGLLLKQDFGVRDTWINRDQSRREIEELSVLMRRETVSVEVDRTYLRRVAQHHIAVGRAIGHVPEAVLLDIAEQIGEPDWQDRRIEVADEAADLIAALDPAERTDAAMAASLRRSGDWIGRERFAESWFEDRAEIRALLSRVPRGDPAAARRLLLAEDLVGGRAAWAERFVLLALWARAARDRAHQGRWGDFAILAQALCGARPLADVPLMAAIAERTVDIGRARGW